MDKKCRAVSVIFYPDNLHHNSWDQVLTLYGLSYEISALHEFDGKKRPHYHVLIYSSVLRDFSFFTTLCKCLFYSQPRIVNDVQVFCRMMEVSNG